MAIIVDKDTNLELYRDVIVFLNKDGNPIKSIEHYDSSKVCMIFDESKPELIKAINAASKQYRSLRSPTIPMKAGIYYWSPDPDCSYIDWKDITDTFLILHKSGFLVLSKNSMKQSND